MMSSRSATSSLDAIQEKAWRCPDLARVMPDSSQPEANWVGGGEPGAFPWSPEYPQRRIPEHRARNKPQAPLPQCPSEHQKLMKKKQKNRVAAQRSRQRHTDKADALHQQYETLEKHNRALRREIQELQEELHSWNRTLCTHKCLCLMEHTTCSPLDPPSGWDHAEPLPGPIPHGQHRSQEQFLSPPVSPASAQRHPPSAPGFLLSSPPSMALGPAIVESPPDLLTAASSSSQLSPFSELGALVPHPTAPPQHPGQRVKLQHPVGPGAAPELAGIAQDWHGLEADPDPQPLLAFPLLSSAQVYLEPSSTPHLTP